MGVVAALRVVAAVPMVRGVRLVAAVHMVRGIMAGVPVRVMVARMDLVVICLNTSKRKKGGKNDPHSFFDYYSDLA